MKVKFVAPEQDKLVIGDEEYSGGEEFDLKKEAYEAVKPLVTLEVLEEIPPAKPAKKKEE